MHGSDPHLQFSLMGSCKGGCLLDINLALLHLLRILGDVNDQGAIVHLGCDGCHVSALWQAHAALHELLPALNPAADTDAVDLMKSSETPCQTSSMEVPCQ